MSGTRLKSELLATVTLSAGDKLAAADVLAALVVAHRTGRMAMAGAASNARDRREFKLDGKKSAVEQWPEDRGRQDLPSREGQFRGPRAAAGTGPDRQPI